MLNAINSRLKRSGEPTPTPFNPKQLFASLKYCSIQPLWQCQEAVLRMLLRLVAKYQGSSSRFRRGSPA